MANITSTQHRGPADKADVVAVEREFLTPYLVLLLQNLIFYLIIMENFFLTYLLSGVIFFLICHPRLHWPVPSLFDFLGPNYPHPKSTNLHEVLENEKEY
jgi:hypothetical protein